MASIVVAHPDPEVVDGVVRATRAWRLETWSTTDTTCVLSLALRRAPEVVILGHHLPHDTAAAVRELRHHARSRVVALAPAAFSYTGLVAAGVERVVSPWASRVDLRRAVKWALALAEVDRGCQAQPTLRLGPVATASIAQAGFSDGRGGLSLTRIEASLLKALAARPGEVVTHAELIQAAWPRVPSHAVPRARLQVHVHNLRRKLHQVGRDAPAIERSFVTGYRLVSTGDLAVALPRKSA